MREHQLYLRAFFEAFNALLVAEGRYSLPIDRKALIEQAHVYATEATNHLKQTLARRQEETPSVT